MAENVQPHGLVSTELPEVPLIEGSQNYGTLTQTIDKVIWDWRLSGRGYYITLGLGVMGAGLLFFTICWLVYQGVGIWGNQIPVAWAWDIVNFVWWIGIGHAGTLISAILLLLQQTWRNSINRFAEAMTIFAVMCAGLFPLLHTGRPWVDYWLLPYPNILAMWPQFRSPLLWDVFAVSTYFAISLVFWYMGLVPDMATLRDRAKTTLTKKIYGVACLGWRGSTKHWHRYEQANLLLAALSTPLVLSVHTIVSYDFAMSIVPGWNVTVFPPYFVAGAVFAGFAMVMNFLIPIRSYYKLQDVVTMKHIDWMCKIMLATGLIVTYGYILELFFGWYSGSKGEVLLTWYRLTGENKWAYYMLILCNCIIPQSMWWPKARQNLLWVWITSAVVGVGMWLERFVIIPMSLQTNPLPAINRHYWPTIWDFAMFAGTLGFFTMMMMLFIRALPTINIFEVRDLLYQMAKKGTTEIQTPAAATVGGGE
jgi:molybdopterin-containing oxidoreductase family membrane subunit